MQVNRMMEMVLLLLSRDVITAGEFADKFGVSTRTVYRDVDTLTLCNVPIVMTKGKNGGISLLKSYKLDKAILTETDKQEILSSLNIFGSIAPDTSGAMTKLKSIFETSQTEIIEIDFDNWSNESGQKELFAELKHAVIHKMKVTFTYHSMSGNSERTVCPVKLCFKGQAWYLYAFCDTKMDYRFFKLSRIRECNRLNDTFDLQVKGNILEHLQPYNDSFIDLHMQISKEKAYRVYDEFRDITILQNGDFLVKGTFPQGDWLYQYIASFLGDCIVLEPQIIRDKMIEIYQTGLSKYLK